jgi:hypothetical protein
MQYAATPYQIPRLIRDRAYYDATARPVLAAERRALQATNAINARAPRASQPRELDSRLAAPIANPVSPMSWVVSGG